MTSIGDYAFLDCTAFTSVTIPDSVTEIGFAAFDGCKSLTSVTIPDSVTEIGDSAFLDTAYYNNPANWSGDVLYLGKWLIEAKNTLSGAYEIKSGTVGIADGAFRWCESLTRVTIPDSVTEIGSGAFSGCASLASVTIPGSVTTIGSLAFAYCASLPAINVAPANTAYTSQNGVLFTKDLKTLHSYPKGKPDTTYVVPNGVTRIASGAFSGCASLTSVTIPDSVKTIGGSAFSDCTSLTSVTIPDSVTEIGGSWDEGGAFCNCTSLTDVYYTGTEAQWKAIEIRYDNDPIVVRYYGDDFLLKAAIHYNTSIDETSGNVVRMTCYGTLESYETETVVVFNTGESYLCLAEITVDGKTYKVKATIDEDAAKVILKQKIAFDLENGEVVSLKKVECMEIGRDNSAFANAYEPFFAAFSIKDYADAEKKSKKKKTANALNRYLSQFRYEISDDVFGKLLSFANDTQKNRLQTQRGMTWGGSCYGICASTALTFRNEINLKNFTGLDGSYYEVTEQVEPKDNAGLRDLINYYQLSYEVKSSRSKSLPEIISYAEKAEQTGEPFIIVFSYTQSGPSKGTADGCHAVLGVGSDGYDSSGTFRVRVIDPNHIDEYINMNISKDSESDNYSAEFSKYYNKADGNCQFSYFGVVTLSDLDFLDMDGPGNNEVTYNPNTTHISFGMNDTVTITDLDTDKTLTYSGGEFSGDIGVVETRYCPGGDFSGKIKIDIEPGSRYKVELDGDTDLMIASDTEFYAFDTFGADSVEVDFDKGATLYGDDIQYTSYVSVGENSDLVSVSGSCEARVGFRKDGTSVEVEGKGNKIEGTKLFVDEKVSEQKVEKSGDSVKLVVAKDKKLRVENASEPAESKDNGVLLAIIAILAAALVVAVVVAIAVGTKKRTQNQPR